MAIGITLELPTDSDIKHVVETIHEFDHDRKSFTYEELMAFDALRWVLVERYKNDPAVDALSLEMGRVTFAASLKDLRASEKFNR